MIFTNVIEIIKGIHKVSLGEISMSFEYPSRTSMGYNAAYIIATREQ
jgi:hypothetical protein